MDRNIKPPKQNKLQKLFGVGPMGAALSLLLLAIFALADSKMNFPVIMAYAGLMKTVGVVLVILGLGLKDLSGHGKSNIK
jgi:hypothetical protein